MPISTDDNMFLAQPFIGAGKKITDVPNFVHTAFIAISSVPSVIKTLCLPPALMSVPKLIALALPTETPTEPLPDPSSYFSKDEPSPVDKMTIDLLKTLSIPPRDLLDQLVKCAGQAWLDGHKSVIYAHTEHDRRFSFWTISFWKDISDVLVPRQIWQRADSYLKTLQQKPIEHVRRAADDFRAALLDLPWHGDINGYSDYGAVHCLAAFASKEWLQDIHETCMLEELQRQLSAVPAFAGNKGGIVHIGMSVQLCAAHTQRNTTTYPPTHRSQLAQLGSDLRTGAKTRVGMMWFVAGDHWCSMAILVGEGSQSVLWGDPMGDEVPDWVRNATVWWLSVHVERLFDWGILECSPQRDGFSCGILAQNGLAHSFLPSRYPLINTKKLFDVSVARLRAGIEVIRRHVEMVSRTSGIRTSSCG